MSARNNARNKSPAPILTCVSGDNSDLFPQILELYVPDGALIADVTYGKGAFWRKVDVSRYHLTPSDLQGGVDFIALPYADESYNCVVLDPPYMNGGAGVKESLNDCYKNPGANSMEAVFRLYMRGVLEAHRVLRRNGVLILKCQPAVADHAQKPIHAQLINGLPPMGLRFEDEFVLRSEARPMMRHQTQIHARKNHSYFQIYRKIR